MDILRELEPDLADAIYNAGFVTAQSIRNASVSDLSKVKGVSESTATKLIEHFMAEAETPAAATAAPAPKEGAKITELERSFSYLVEEDKPETSYSLFLNAMMKGMKGYCITRNYPAKIRSRFDLKDTPVVWLSNVGRENTIRPKDLEKLSLTLE